MHTKMSVSSILIMKNVFWNLPVLAASILLTSCASKSTPELPKAALPASYHSFNPPKGDPRTDRDWRRYGPGSIIRTPAQTQYVNASVVIGPKQVGDMVDSSNWTPIEMRRGSEEQKVLTEAAASYTYQELVSAGISLETLKELQFTYEFGKTYDVQIPERDFFQTLVQNKQVIDKPLAYLLKTNQAHIIQGVLVTDSLTVTAKDSRNRKVDFHVKLTEEQKANLTSEKTSVKESELTFAEPRFAAYLAANSKALRDHGIVK